jgi:hypothetical protein
MIAIPFLTPYLIGISVSKLVGFSFFSLRLISIVETFSMVFLLNEILLLLNVKNHFNRFCVLLLFCFNPLVLSLANTFLPDTCILLLGMISIYLMIKLFYQYSKGVYFGFIFLTVLGSLTRQSNLIIPFVFGFLYFFSTSKSLLSFRKAFFPFLINLILLLLFENIARFYKILPLNFNLQVYSITRNVQFDKISILRNLIIGFFSSTICLGLFIFPLLISCLKTYFFQIVKSRIALVSLFIYLIFITLKIILANHFEPSLGNMLYSFGIGPIIMTGFESSRFLEYSVGLKFVLILINFIGAFSFIFSIFLLLLNWKRDVFKLNYWCGLFFCLMLILYLTAISFNYANDRYLMFLIPFYFIAFIIAVPDIRNKTLFFISFSFIFSYSVIGVKDYFDFNTTRWKALNFLTHELKISPNKIDGGFEFNALYCNTSESYNAHHIGRWWWIEDDEFIITPKSRNGYSVLRSYQMKSIVMLPFEKLYILKRDN